MGTAVVVANGRDGDDMTLEEEGCDTVLPREDDDSMREDTGLDVVLDIVNDDCMLEDDCEEVIPRGPVTGF